MTCDGDALDVRGGWDDRHDHLPTLGPVRGAAALGFVHVLASGGVALGPGIVLQRPRLGGHGQVHILPVAGAPSVEGSRPVVMLVRRAHSLLVSSRLAR